MAEPTKWWLSYTFVDLRFLITRADDETTRDKWLAPTWLKRHTTKPVVGKLGKGTPMPGRDRMVRDYNNHASLDGFLLLQTPDEREARALTRTEHDGFVFLDRELVADDEGQVRLDMIVEARGDWPDPRALVESLLEVRMVMPLADDAEVRLIEAGEQIAQVYETESAKTSEGYAEDPASALAAARGTVVATAPLLIVRIDAPEPAPDDATPWHAECKVPCIGTLRALLAIDETLCFRFAPRVNEFAYGLEERTLNALFGCAQLIGQFHEATILRDRIEEYSKRDKDAVLLEMVRTRIKNHNRRFGKSSFGGWQPIEMLTGVAAIIALRDKGPKEQLDRIRNALHPYASDLRDLAGITNNIVQIVNNAEKIDMNSIIGSSITGSNINQGSTLIDVAQTIGQMPVGDGADREALKAQVENLAAELKKLSEADSAHNEQVEAIEVKTKEAIDQAAKPKPNKTLLTSALDGAKTIATGIGDVATPVLGAITTIAAIIAKIHGF